jgi:hypothetical protein
MKRMLVTASRTWTNEAAMRRTLARHYEPGAVLVVGGARGGDRIAEKIWRDLGGQVERHDADWDRHGKAAGAIRNAEMAAADISACVAFVMRCEDCGTPEPHGTHGTVDCIGRAKAAGIEVEPHRPPAVTERQIDETQWFWSEVARRPCPDCGAPTAVGFARGDVTEAPTRCVQCSAEAISNAYRLEQYEKGLAPAPKAEPRQAPEVIPFIPAPRLEVLPELETREAEYAQAELF